MAEGDLSILAQYGVLGVFAILLIIFAKTAYKRETERADRLEQEVLRLNQLIQDKHIPALESATYALKEATDALQKVKWDQQRDRDDR